MKNSILAIEAPEIMIHTDHILKDGKKIDDLIDLLNRFITSQNKNLNRRDIIEIKFNKISFLRKVHGKNENLSQVKYPFKNGYKKASLKKIIISTFLEWECDYEENSKDNLKEISFQLSNQKVRIFF